MQEIGPHSTIYFAWNYVEWGGAQIYTLALIKEVRKHFDVLVVLPSGSSEVFTRFLDEMGVKYDFFSPPADFGPAPTLERKIQRHWRKLRSENALIKHLSQFDLKNAIVHIDFAPQNSLISLVRLCRRTNVFFTCHNSLPAFPKYREMLWTIKLRLISRFENFHIFCANVDAKLYLSKFVSNKTAERIDVTYASINPLEIDEAAATDSPKRELSEKLGLPPDRFIVLVVGQFIDRKGRWTFLEAATKVVQDQPEVLFVWLTPTLPNDEETTQIKTFGLGESFRLIHSAAVGAKRRDILRFYRIADIFALPSYVEGLPIALLEAMALGLPCISTNVNGIPEAIHSEETGLLIEPGKANELAAAIQKLKEDPELRRSLGDRGRAFVLENFDERKTAKIAVREYKKCLNQV